MSKKYLIPRRTIVSRPQRQVFAWFYFFELFDIFGNHSRSKELMFTNDHEALRHDWFNIGNDIRSAMTRYEQEQKA